MKIRYLIGLTVIFLVACWGGLSANARTAKDKARQIVAADQESLDTKTAQRELADYVYSHMNSSVQYTLRGSFDRATETVHLANQPQVSGQVYQQAQAACAGRADSIAQSRCVTGYLSQHAPTNPSSTPAELPKLADFTIALHAPRWTPDLAGLSLLAAMATAALTGWLALARRL